MQSLLGALEHGKIKQLRDWFGQRASNKRRGLKGVQNLEAFIRYWSFSL